jgi:hypothetical protein
LIAVTALTAGTYELLIQANLRRCRSKKEIQRVEGHDLNSSMAFPAKELFEGLNSTSRRMRRCGSLKYAKLKNEDTSLMEHGGTAG